jgi:hypothetical protein
MADPVLWGSAPIYALPGISRAGPTRRHPAIAPRWGRSGVGWWQPCGGKQDGGLASRVGRDHAAVVNGGGWGREPGRAGETVASQRVDGRRYPGAGGWVNRTGQWVTGRRQPDEWAGRRDRGRGNAEAPRGTHDDDARSSRLVVLAHLSDTSGWSPGRFQRACWWQVRHGRGLAGEGMGFVKRGLSGNLRSQEPGRRERNGALLSVHYTRQPCCGNQRKHHSKRKVGAAISRCRAIMNNGAFSGSKNSIYIHFRSAVRRKP